MFPNIASRRLKRIVTTITGIGALLPLSASAQTSTSTPQNPPAFQSTVQVTATRFGEPVVEVPGSISVITGDEIRARGANDLRTALALLGGVSVAPGGDAGPAGAVPGLLGVREVDDLLLLIDGIPAGGAFIPQVEAISLNNVERIEVMRGAAPVYFGTTAFAGTINVIHYAAGSADRVTGFRFGSYQSGGVGGATVLSSGRVRQSISGELSQNNSPTSAPITGVPRASGGWPLSWAAATSAPTWTCWPCARSPTPRRRSTRRPGRSPRCCRLISTRIRPTPSWTPIATRWCSTTTCRCPSDAGATRPPTPRPRPTACAASSMPVIRRSRGQRRPTPISSPSSSH